MLDVAAVLNFDSVYNIISNKYLIKITILYGNTYNNITIVYPFKIFYIPNY